MMMPRRPNLFLVTLFYLLLTTFLLLLVVNLSEVGRFLNTEMLERSSEALGNFFQTGQAPLVELPELSLTPFGLVFLIIPLLFIWILDLGYLFYAKETIKGETLGFQSLFEGFNYLIRAVFLRVFVGILVFVGVLFFIFPGLWVLCAFSQANLLLLDHPNRGAFWCLRESLRLMRGHKMEYLTLLISFLGWYLLTITPIIHYAARIWYIPYSTFTYVNYYNTLTGSGPPEEPEWKRPGMF